MRHQWLTTSSHPQSGDLGHNAWWMHSKKPDPGYADRGRKRRSAAMIPCHLPHSSPAPDCHHSVGKLSF